MTWALQSASTKLTRTDDRRGARKPACYVGWLASGDGAAVIRCYVSDVGRSGARVRLFGRSMVPDEFTLHFSRTGDAQIRCRVRWRGDGEVGVEFGDERTAPCH